MKHNRILAILLALCMATMLLVGCGTDQTDGTPTPDGGAAGTTATPDPADPDQNIDDQGDQGRDDPVDYPSNAEPTDIRVAALKGPTGMGMAWLMDEASQGKAYHNYTFTLANTPNEIESQLIANQIDIAAVPINRAATLYNKTDGQVQLLAVNTLGVLHVVENGDTVQELSDLKGKTVYATGKGSTPEYIINYILEKNHLTEDVTVEYKTDHSELAALIAAGEVDIAILPEPHVTAACMKNDALRVALDLTDEWDRVSDTKLIQGCVVARKEFVEKNPIVVNDFLFFYNISADYPGIEPDIASELMAKHEIMASKEAAYKAIPNCNLVYLAGEMMKNDASAMLQVLYDADADSVGGALPGDDFYYIKTSQF